MTTPTPDNAASATVKLLPFVTVEQVNRYRAESLRVETERDSLAATVTALEAEVERLRDSLDALIQAASPMVTDDIQHERVIEKGSRGHTSISIDPFPLMKFRHEDMRDLKSELERARKTLTGAGAK